MSQSAEPNSCRRGNIICLTLQKPDKYKNLKMGKIFLSLMSPKIITSNIMTENAYLTGFIFWSIIIKRDPNLDYGVLLKVAPST